MDSGVGLANTRGVIELPAWDVLIKGGKVVDGTGAGWFLGDVAVHRGRIAAVEPNIGGSARETIDAKGLVVAPGFIDAHSHSDDSALVSPRLESKVRQGVTTEVIGNCGYSLAPLSAGARETIQAELDDLEVAVNWRSFGQYLRRVKAGGIAANLVPLVGHGTVRESVMGDVNRPPRLVELERMKTLVAKAMRQGARGFSSGLIYPPSSYADIAELMALAEVAGQFGGVYTTHIRGEGETLLEAVNEALAVSEAVRVPVQLSHHKAAGEGNWGKVTESLKLVDAARRRGVDVTLDVYPYTAAATSLKTVLPGWAQEGGNRKLLARLMDPDTREELRQAAEADANKRGGWDKILICAVKGEANRWAVGLNMAQVAERRSLPPAEAALDLLVAGEGSVDMARFLMCEDDVAEVMRHPLAMIGSDATARAPYGPLAKAKPHPRAYGTFPRVLGHYVRDRKLLTLEEAVRKMTSLPAARFRLWDRGLVRPGMAADLTLFDPDHVADKATYAEPHQFPAGIPYVLVNGLPVMMEGEATPHLPGRIL